MQWHLTDPIPKQDQTLLFQAEEGSRGHDIQLAKYIYPLLT